MDNVTIDGIEYKPLVDVKKANIIINGVEYTPVVKSEKNDDNNDNCEENSNAEEDVVTFMSRDTCPHCMTTNHDSDTVVNPFLVSMLHDVGKKLKVFCPTCKKPRLL